MRSALGPDCEQAGPGETRLVPLYYATEITQQRLGDIVAK